MQTKQAKPLVHLNANSDITTRDKPKYANIILTNWLYFIPVKNNNSVLHNVHTYNIPHNFYVRYRCIILC